MADDAKKNNKNLIIGICVSAIAIIAIVIAIVLVVKGGTFALNDDYFKSDDTKIVVEIAKESMEFDDNGVEYTPVKAYTVYTYTGDEITSMKAYADYTDAATAEKAFNALKASNEELAAKAELSGKYIILNYSPEQYEGTTASMIKDSINADTEEDDGSGELRVVENDEDDEDVPEIVEEIDESTENE